MSFMEEKKLRMHQKKGVGWGVCGLVLCCFGRSCLVVCFCKGAQAISLGFILNNILLDSWLTQKHYTSCRCIFFSFQYQLHVWLRASGGGVKNIWELGDTLKLFRHLLVDSVKGEKRLSGELVAPYLPIKCFCCSRCPITRQLTKISLG